MRSTRSKRGVTKGEVTREHYNFQAQHEENLILFCFFQNAYVFSMSSAILHILFFSKKSKHVLLALLKRK
jgi:hypothetical protein